MATVLLLILSTPALLLRRVEKEKLYLKKKIINLQKD